MKPFSEAALAADWKWGCGGRSPLPGARTKFGTGRATGKVDITVLAVLRVADRVRNADAVLAGCLYAVAWGPSGTIIRRSYRFLVILHKNM